MRPWSVTFVVFISALIVTAAACWAVWVFMLNPAAGAVKTATLLHTRFNTELPVSPRIHANAGALFAQSSSSEEFVLLESAGTVRETIDGVLPQAKGLVVESAFAAKTGIRSRETFHLDVRPGGRVVDCTLPAAKILSLELAEPSIVDPAGMEWDALPEKTRHRARRTLERAAKNLLEEDDIPSKARAALQARVTTIIDSADCRAVFAMP